MVSGKNRTKATKIFLHLLLAVLLLAAFAAAASAATHTITKVKGTTITRPAGLAAGDTIVVTGDRLEPETFTFVDTPPDGDWAVLRDCPVTFNLVLERETTVVGGAFYECYNLASVSLPVATNIGYVAFYSCYSLKSVSLPAATNIGEMAFFFCFSLTSASMPAATSIGDHAFRNTSLTSVSLPAATTIGNYAFSGCRALTSVSLPIATNIGSYAFSDAPLTSVSLPAATTIGDHAYSGSKTLTSVSLPAATTIGKNVFTSCASLTSVSLPAATTIGDYAFAKCRALTSISLPAATTIENHAFFDCAQLASVSLPVVTNIREHLFSGCSALRSVSLPSATSIGDNAFYYCTALASISLPAATNVGQNAFEGCARLTSISLPAATKVGQSAFTGCDKLTCAVVSDDKPSGWDNSAFPDTGTVPLIMPSSGTWTGDNPRLVLSNPEDYANASKAYVVSADKGPVKLDSGLHESTYFTAHQWYRDGTSINGANGATVGADRSGVYQISFVHNNNTYRLPETRVVIGLQPAFEDGAEVEDAFPSSNGYALNRTFRIAGGSPPPAINVFNPLPSVITDTKTADAVTLAGMLPASVTATYRFTLMATNDFTFWTKPAMLVYRANTRAEVVAVNAALQDLNGNPLTADTFSVYAPPSLAPGVANGIFQHFGASVVSAVKPIEQVPGDCFAVSARPVSSDSATTPLAWSFNTSISTANATTTTARGAAGDVYILPLSITYFHNALSADLPDNWKTMTDAARAKWLTDDGSDRALAFAYEYVPKSGDAAQPPVPLIGPGGMLTWGDALSAGIVTVDASGDLTINYIPLTGTGDPFVVENWLVIPDGEPYPGYLTDPLWLLRVPASSGGGGGGGVGCGAGAGAMAIFALLALRRRRDR
ncbi:leucine-rich repeat domain-containing protein [Synergistaceae bacterium OttesenSCG-928-I11]|nr:leucine-rich repeat domain-containing protein [Synergistaceae bacterium OttesenSCG-928-I11]